VARLGHAAAQVLVTAAVIGRDFDLELLECATRVPVDDLLDILEAAETAALVREVLERPGRYSFRHALIQHTLHEELGPTRRARAHQHVAEALEELCAGVPGSRVGELAHHWIEATKPTTLPKAIRYSKEAGDTALRSLAPDDALHHYAKALELSVGLMDPDPVSLVDLAIGLGTAQRQTGEAVVSAPRCSTPPARRDTSATWSDSWPLPSPTTGASTARWAPSTPRRWRSSRRPLNSSAQSTPTARWCSPRCAPSSPMAARSNVGVPWPTRR